jgi:prevent-host-death family protein
MIRLGVVEARRKFSKTISRVEFGKERIVLERRGEEVAAVVPMDDLVLLQALEDKIDLAAARKALREPGTVSWEKLKAELGL